LLLLVYSEAFPEQLYGRDLINLLCVCRI